jgi:hypothetical protein
MLTMEVSQMTGIGIPPIDPGTSAGGSIWPGVVAAVVLVVVLGAAIWTYVRNRPMAARRSRDDFELPKAA